MKDLINYLKEKGNIRFKISIPLDKITFNDIDEIVNEGLIVIIDGNSNNAIIQEA